MAFLALVREVWRLLRGHVDQVWNPDDAEEEVLVMVCRTGLHTTMGGIIQQLLTPTRMYKEKDPFLLVGYCHSCLS